MATLPVLHSILPVPPLRRFSQRAKAGFALADSMMAVAVLGLVVSTVIYGLTRANWSAASERNRSVARAFCQQSIEQALTGRYDPPRRVPTVFGTWPVPATETEVVNETVPLFTDSQTGMQPVNGTRTCRVTLLANNVVRFTVRVAWQYRGRPFTLDLHTLRAPDTIQ